jgi:ArsR family transcriptional regulator
MREITDISAAFSEEIRLRMVLILWKSKLCVKCLVAVTEAAQPTVSRHLSILRAAGLVTTERRGSHIYYELDYSGDNGALKRELLRVYHGNLGQTEPFIADREKLAALALECDAECLAPFDSESCAVVGIQGKEVQ